MHNVFNFGKVEDSILKIFPIYIIYVKTSLINETHKEIDKKDNYVKRKRA